MKTENVFETELAARKFMAELDTKGISYSYWHVSICEHRVTIKD